MENGNGVDEMNGLHPCTSAALTASVTGSISIDPKSSRSSRSNPLEENELNELAQQTNQSLSPIIPTKRWTKCSGCGQGPRLVPDSTGSTMTTSTPQYQALLRCSSCQQVAYHDVVCQRKHYQQHRQACRRFRRCHLAPDHHHHRCHGSESHIVMSSIPAGNATVSAPSSLSTKVDSEQICSDTKQAVTVARSDRIINNNIWIQYRVGRGMSALATQSLSPGQWVGCYHPLIPPVVMTNQRTCICAVCFTNITTSSIAPDDARTYNLSQHDQYPVVLCSKQCHIVATTCTPGAHSMGRTNHSTIDATWFSLQEETSIVVTVLQQRAVPYILPTALLVFRILVTAASADMYPSRNTSIIDQQLSKDKAQSWIEDLSRIYDGTNRKNLDSSVTDSSQHPSDENSSNYDVDDAKDGDRIIHEQAVLRTVFAFVQVWSQRLQNKPSTMIYNKILHSPTYIQSILRRIRFNAFTIMDEWNGNVLGLALMESTACSLNHDCAAANVLQSFDIGVHGSWPRLRLTTTKTVAVDEELLLSYCDPNTPHEQRHTMLKHQYNFICTCSFCQNHNHDDEIRIVAWKCQRQPPCNGTLIRSQQVINREGSLMICNQCGAISSSFSDHNTLLRDIQECLDQDDPSDIKEPHRRHQQPDNHMSHLPAWNRLYEQAQRLLHPISWYRYALADRLSQWHIQSLTSVSTNANPPGVQIVYHTQEVCRFWTDMRTFYQQQRQFRQQSHYLGSTTAITNSKEQPTSSQISKNHRYDFHEAILIFRLNKLLYTQMGILMESDSAGVMLSGGISTSDLQWARRILAMFYGREHILWHDPVWYLIAT